MTGGTIYIPHDKCPTWIFSIMDGWSLIAGRLPGRTANDVKNYWNTHFKKKMVVPSEPMYPREKHNYGNMVKIQVIKPRPRTFSSRFSIRHSDKFNPTPMKSYQPQPVAYSENETNWWESLLLDNQLAIVEEGATTGADITSSVVAADHASETVANENWHVNDWSANTSLDHMALNWLELFHGNGELII
ncbi:hypothetical protein SAY87_021717 [Trapa incisa]|uniref:Uncharacterized protein n=1 Tax=Trapa incisa TaxID=236973 RepID=A0AAN7JSC1_9MYRT|nr:hypothetical protein SAY87_021717 [Trapa incisa]